MKNFPARTLLMLRQFQIQMEKFVSEDYTFEWYLNQELISIFEKYQDLFSKKHGMTRGNSILI